MTLTNTDVRKELQVWAIRNDHQIYDFSAFVHELDANNQVELDSGTARLVKSSSDYDTAYRVFSLGDQFFTLEGSTDSWDEGDWDSYPYEVKPQPVNEVHYQRVK